MTWEPQTDRKPDLADESPTPEELPHNPVAEHRGPLRRAGGAIVAGFLLLLKWAGAALALLGKTKFLFTFLISIGAWALVAPLPFAIGIVVMLLAHELGHAIWAKREGLEVSAITFVPFLGAATLLEKPKDVYTDAKVAMAGPAIGGLAAAAALWLGNAQDSDAIRMVAYTGFLLNLFNLAPVTPLDGGTIAQAFHPAFWLVGLFAVALLAFAHPNIILWLILAACAYSFYRSWTHRNDPAFLAYRRISWRQRVTIGVAVLLLACALVAGMEASYVHRAW
jgi:Zn-dependent protease